ncbi:MAG: xylulokinase [Verrucomicrobia bacterium]|nr:xylulokinase [Verrucomicrobiota bacterium]
MSALLGIDLGTSSVKVVVYSTSGNILGLGSAEYPILTPRPGWAEQDPQTWWRATVHSVNAACQAAGRPEILGVGFSGQMHGPVFLDKAGRLLGNAIIWADQRSASLITEIESTVGKKILAEVCGTDPAASFLISTLRWLQIHDSGRLEKIGKVLLPKDYVRYRMTNEIATDASDAAATGLFDVARRTWAWGVIDTLKLPREIFPEVRGSSESCGKLLPDPAAELGIKPGISLAAGAADQPSQAVGNGLIEPGLGSVTLGTGGQVFVPLSTPVFDSEARCHTFCHAPDSRWYLLGAMLSAGMALRWARHTLGCDDLAYQELDRRAETVPIGAEDLFFLPYLVGERSPLMDPHARGTFVGLTLRHETQHLIRAVLEGISYAMRQIIETIEGTGVKMDRWVASGNGLASQFWRQMLADTLNRPLLRGNDANAAERAGVGAAILGGIGAGILSGFNEAQNFAPRFDEVTEPVPGNVEGYDRAYARFARVYPLLKDWFRG